MFSQTPVFPGLRGPVLAPLHRPDHAAAACRAALALQQVQAELRSRWAADGRQFPAEVLQMRTRIGLNTGAAVVGNVGSEVRFNYTMMGSAVNLAQRMEAAASHYGVDILASSSTVTSARRDEPQLIFRELDRVTFAGLASSVAVFELLGVGPSARETRSGLMEEYAAALALYREGRWDDAAEAFVRASQHESSASMRNPSVVMAARCRDFASKAKKPDGDFVLAKS